MKMINLTKSDIKVGNKTIASSGFLPPFAKVVVEEKETIKVDKTEISLYSKTTKSIQGLPKPQKDTYFIVPFNVAQAMPSRKDLTY